MRREPKVGSEELAMFDVLYLILIAVLFALSIAMIRFFERM